MEKTRDINIVRRVSSPLISQAQSMLNASKPTAPFNDQRALNEVLKHHAVSPEETHEKPLNLSDKEANSQCFSRYLLHSVAIRLSALINVTRIPSSFAFGGEVFDDEAFVDADNKLLIIEKFKKSSFLKI